MKLITLNQDDIRNIVNIIISEQDENITQSDYEPCVRGGSTQIHKDDIIFFKKFKEQYGFLPYPRMMEKLGGSVKVGDIYPEHPMGHLTTKSFYICKSKVFKEIKIITAKELGIVTVDSGLRGSKNYLTLDGKHVLRSIFEVVFYNTFYINGLSDKLEVDSRKFYDECGEINKEVDFIYDNKVVIEVAGMTEQSYFEKIEDAMRCIESLGYSTKVYKVRQMGKRYMFSEFYEQICVDFGLPIDKNIINNPSEIIGHNNLNIEHMKKFIDDNISTVTQNSDSKTYVRMRSYIKKLYNQSVREYRKEKGIKQQNRKTF